MDRSPIKEIVETRSDDQLHWTLDRPERANALTPTMLNWVESRAKQLDGELVLLSSPHARFFSAGFDLRALEAGVQALPDHGELSATQFPDAALVACTRALSQAHACLVAIVDAPAVGAAVELLSYFDYIFITARASFRIPAGELGLLYHSAGLTQIQHRFGDQAAFDMLVCGEVISAQRMALQPRFSYFEDTTQLQKKLGPWCNQLLQSAPHARGPHCAHLRGPAQAIDPQKAGAYHAARAQAYRRPELAAALAKKTR